MIEVIISKKAKRKLDLIAELKGKSFKTVVDELASAALLVEADREMKEQKDALVFKHKNIFLKKTQQI